VLYGLHHKGLRFCMLLMTEYMLTEEFLVIPSIRTVRPSLLSGTVGRVGLRPNGTLPNMARFNDATEYFFSSDSNVVFPCRVGGYTNLHGTSAQSSEAGSAGTPSAPLKEKPLSCKDGMIVLCMCLRRPAPFLFASSVDASYGMTSPLAVR
jgi:hypothetical protein